MCSRDARTVCVLVMCLIVLGISSYRQYRQTSLVESVLRLEAETWKMSSQAWQQAANDWKAAAAEWQRVATGGVTNDQAR